MKEVEVIKARNDLQTRTRGKTIELMRVGAYCRVSTDSADQLNSYKSQVAYYTDMIKKNKEWVLADIYADEAITGTQVAKREDFQRMINDCMNGEIDMVITKSISRFARNTLDTLKYVRVLKERNIAVYFEDEKINTLTMDGELLLVVLSSVAQQEVENISANVKKGLKMKMKRGELVGFQGCLGYDYHKDTKTITVNEEEAEIVRYIFNRYIEGAGGSVIAHELENLGYKTKYGSSTWVQSTVIGIIKNEKYKGDLLLGKTFTVDPISKRRLENFGEEDKFYIRNHHEPIISEEVFEKAQEILSRRNVNRGKIGEGNTKREKYSRKYAFSCMLECGFCGGTLTRRNWHSSSQYSKVIWQCVTATKKGKKFCKHSKGIPETAIEEAFVESYRLLCDDNKDVLEEFLQRMDDTLSCSAVSKQLAKAEKEIDALEKKKSKLVDMRLEEIVDKETYESKYADLVSKQEQLVEERQKLQETSDNEKDIKKRLKEFKKTLEQNEVLDKFDRYVFESIVEKVIVGGLDENGNVDPAQLTFVYKTGLKNSVDGAKFKPQRKNARGRHRTDELCSHDSNEVDKMCSDSSNDTRRDSGRFQPLTGESMMRRILRLLACGAVVLSLVACTPTGRAVGDTQDSMPSIAHDSTHKTDITVGFVGSTDTAADKKAIDALADDTLNVYYASLDTSGDSETADKIAATAQQGVTDFVDRAVKIVIISGIDVTDANRDSWNQALTNAREAGIPVALLNPKHAPEDELLYAAILDTDDAASAKSVSIADAVITITRDEPHDRTIAVATE